MRNCKKCDKQIPNWIFIDGKHKNTSSRKYCLECSPFGLHNTRKIEKPIPDRRKKPIRKFVCPSCNQTRMEKTTTLVCGTCKNKAKRHFHKQKAIDVAGGVCVVCGYTKCKSALHFHHLNDKRFTISRCLHWSWEQLQEELKKCVLVCNRCHSEIHEGLTTLPDCN